MNSCVLDAINHIYAFSAGASMWSATYKVPGGKLVRIRFHVRDGMVQSPQFSGDFFFMPPEKLPSLEQFLIGWRLAVPNGEEILTGRFAKFLQRERIELAGVDAASLAHTVYLATEQSPTEESS